MTDYTISETFSLPSKGLIYPKVINPQITLRAMNTMDEMKRLSISELKNKPMCDVIDGCIVSDFPMSSYDLCLGDYQFLLHRLRMVTYGSKIKIETSCPYCRFYNEDSFDLNRLDVVYYDDEIKKYEEFDLPVSKKHIKIRYQTPRTVDRITVDSLDLKRKSANKNQDYSMIVTLQNIIDEVDGKKVDYVAMENWIRELPMQDANTIFSYATKLNDYIGINPDMEAVCSLCGATYKVKFVPGDEFFRPSLEI